MESLWSIFAIHYNIHFLVRVTPIIPLLLYAYTKIGMVFLIDKNIQCLSRILLGIAFICGGLMTIAFVIFVNIPGIIQLLSPWIYFFNSLIAITMSIGLLDVSLRKQMNELKLSEAHYKKAAQDLKESEELHNKILELLPDAVFIHKGEMYILSVARDISERKKAEKLQLVVIQKEKQLAKADEYAENTGINLIFDTQVEEKIITCDADKLERVMLNLLSNAIKFTDPGGTIEVNIKDKDEFIAISVKDTGIEIPEDKKQLIFERFGQVDSSLTRKREGSGIGLSLVKSIVEYHGGRITLESEFGKGSEC